MKCHGPVLALAAIAHASQHIFSVHDDIVAYPQYDIAFADNFLLQSDAESRVAAAVSRSSTSPSPNKPSSASHVHDDDDGRPESQAAELSETRQHATSQDSDESLRDERTYEIMYLDERQYLCTIPTVAANPKNETAEAAARATEEKELARATVRGWELLLDMQGSCLYFVSGWWSYEFCYNGHVKQFHHMPPLRGAALDPPREDLSTPSYILGTARPLVGRTGDQRQRVRAGEIGDSRTGVESTELQTKGDVRYLVQKLGAGTVCDLTGKERRIEVQYHCHPHSRDRIGWIKEVVTCSYLMVIYTPRLCNDVAFLPPRNDQAHLVRCHEVLRPEEVDGWKSRKASEAEEFFGGGESARDNQAGTSNRDYQQKQQFLNIGGTEVGARKFVGGDGRRIEPGGDREGDGSGAGESDGGSGSGSGSNGQANVIASSAGRDKTQGNGQGRGEPFDDKRRPGSGSGSKNDAGVQHVSDDELRRLELDPKTIENFKKEIQELAGDRGWKIEIVDVGDDDYDGDGRAGDGGEGQGGEGSGVGRNDGRAGGDRARRAREDASIGGGGGAGMRVVRGVIDGDDDGGEEEYDDYDNYDRVDEEGRVAVGDAPVEGEPHGDETRDRTRGSSADNNNNNNNNGGGGSDGGSNGVDSRRRGGAADAQHGDDYSDGSEEVYVIVEEV